MSTEKNIKKVTVKTHLVESKVEFVHDRGTKDVLEHELRDHFRIEGAITQEQHGVEIYAEGLGEIIAQADDLFSNARAEGLHGPEQVILELVPKDED